jgi:hypothetical protein
MAQSWIPAAIAVAISAHPISNEDVLSLSVLNEVEHAISVAPTNAPPTSWTPPTNGLSRTAMAVRLVSSQRPDGRWMDGTNDVTSAVLRTLRDLSE